MAGKKLGKRALFLGALAQSIPDLDFISAFWNDTASNLLAHRGFTHSFFFATIGTLLFALIAEHWHKKHKLGFSAWVWFFGVELATHLFLDLFNAYGTGLFEPFSHQRISFNTLFVADPFFSLWPAIAFVVLLVLARRDKRRLFWWRFGVVLSGIYLMYALVNKAKIHRDSRDILLAQHIPHDRYFTSPTPLNNWLWYIVSGNDSGFYIGYRSVFDRKKETDFHYFPRNDYLLLPFAGQEELQHLIRFSQGYYTVEQWHDTIVFNDLRFGQMVGWYNPREAFVFHYYLSLPEQSNRLVVQRGRFAKWDIETMKSLLKRIRGN